MYELRQTRTQRVARVLILLFCRALIFILTRRQVKGTDNIPERGPLLVASNHMSMADQHFVVVSFKRRLIFMAKHELFRHLPIRLLVQAYGAFPVYRGGMDRKALKQANRVLDSGLALFIFPEGKRSKNGQLQPAFPGSALIALHNSVPILPIGITGLENTKKGPLWHIIHRPRVTVNIGRPFYLPATNDKLTKENLRELADFIMERIAELLPPEYRGHYARKTNSDGTKD